MFEQIPMMPQLGSLERDFFPYYVFTAVRKFIFFLDPMKKGKIRIRDILNSPILYEFNRLRQQPEGDALDAAALSLTSGASSSSSSSSSSSAAAAAAALGSGAEGLMLLRRSGGGKKPPDWFSSQSAVQVYANYLNLDTDHNGMLSKKEFSRFNQGSLTSVFVDRLFQEYKMYPSKVRISLWAVACVLCSSYFFFFLFFFPHFLSFCVLLA